MDLFTIDVDKTLRVLWLVKPHFYQSLEKKTFLRKYARWLIKNRASFKQLDHELEISNTLRPRQLSRIDVEGE